jgi:hypothetical protein
MADTPPKGKRKRGRPPGAKNKIKPESVPVDALADAAAAAAEAPDPEAPIGDAPPGSEAREGKAPRRRNRVTKKGTQAIEDALTEILQIPAVPAAMFGDNWMAEHFTVQGRQLANRIAITSERNPVLRGWCERAMEGEGIAVLLIASVMYAAPPLMHFGVIPGGQMMGIPVLRKPQAGPGPVPAAEQPHTSAREPVPAQPYGGEPTEPVPSTAGEQAVPQTEASPSPPQGERVAPEAHFVGGTNGEGPPLWSEQMIGE